MSRYPEYHPPEYYAAEAEALHKLQWRMANARRKKEFTPVMEEGNQARQQGIPMHENPYRGDTAYSIEWAAGWMKGLARSLNRRSPDEPA